MVSFVLQPVNIKNVVYKLKKTHYENIRRRPPKRRAPFSLCDATELQDQLSADKILVYVGRLQFYALK